MTELDFLKEQITKYKLDTNSRIDLMSIRDTM
jgi:hypothetical protein